MAAGSLNNGMSSQPPLGEYILGYCAHSEAALGYARKHLDRLVKTLEMTPPGTAADSALEIGAYMQITPALQYRLGYGEVRGADLGPLGKQVEKTAESASGETFRCTIDLFNAEKDRFPYEDGSFATVLCCEVLEHLEADPMHMMAEFNRVIRDGGHLLMTTPNACSLRAVAGVLAGYQPQFFSQYPLANVDGSADPRHAREYAAREMPDLYAAAGFETVVLETGPYGEADESGFDSVKELLAKWEFSLELRGECVYALGRKTGAVRDRYPLWLYA